MPVCHGRGGERSFELTGDRLVGREVLEEVRRTGIEEDASVLLTCTRDGNDLVKRKVGVLQAGKEEIDGFEVHSHWRVDLAGRSDVDALGRAERRQVRGEVDLGFVDDLKVWVGGDDFKALGRAVCSDGEERRLSRRRSPSGQGSSSLRDNALCDVPKPRNKMSAELEEDILPSRGEAVGDDQSARGDGKAELSLACPSVRHVLPTFPPFRSLLLSDPKGTERTYDFFKLDLLSCRREGTSVGGCSWNERRRRRSRWDRSFAMSGRADPVWDSSRVSNSDVLMPPYSIRAPFRESVGCES